MWLILWGLWAMFGCGWVKRSDGRRNSSQSSNGTGRGSPTFSPFVERGAVAFAVEAVGGGGLPRRTSQPRRRNNSAPPGTLPAVRLSSSPFKRSLLHINKTVTKQTQRPCLLGVDKCPPLCPPLCPPRPLFFFFLFFIFSFLFPFYSFIFSFSFILLFFSFRFSSFPFRFSFFFFSFFFFSLPQFLQPSRRRQRVSPFPLFSPCCPCGVFP